MVEAEQSVNPSDYACSQAGEPARTITQRLIGHDCPYGSSDCPHTQEIKCSVKGVKDDIKEIKARVHKNEHMLWVIIVFLASEFGMTFLNLFPTM